jgi:hypothetical protein
MVKPKNPLLLDKWRAMKRISTKKQNNKVRREVLEFYGGYCACCGFDNLLFKVRGRFFLEIDHIAGGGRKELRSKFDNSSAKFYRYLRRVKPSGFRVLCAGCNVSMEPNAERCALHA